MHVLTIWHSNLLSLALLYTYCQASRPVLLYFMYRSQNILWLYTKTITLANTKSSKHYSHIYYYTRQMHSIVVSDGDENNIMHCMMMTNTMMACR